MIFRIKKILNKDETYFTVPVIVEVQDKKKGALVVYQEKTYLDEQKTDLCIVNTFNIFIRGIGGFESTSKNYKKYIEIPRIPKTAPDAVIKVKILFMIRLI